MKSMRPKRQGTIARQSRAERDRHDQEVVRANRVLAAYFKGRRTEREALAAIKIIKAFVRDRERRDAKSLPPLPGMSAPRARRARGRRKPEKRATTGPKLVPPHASSEPGEAPEE
jgi:hypothetical protein